LEHAEYYQHSASKYYWNAQSETEAEHIWWINFVFVVDQYILVGFGYKSIISPLFITHGYNILS